MTEGTVTLLGSSKAGKTTLIRYLETRQPVLERPGTTYGVDVRKKTIQVGHWSIKTIDVGGQDIYKEAFWSMIVEMADAIIYVIDGLLKEGEEFETSAEGFRYLKLLLPDEEVKKIPIAILVNKQDLKKKNPLDPNKADQLYDISTAKSLTQHPYALFPTSAKYGEGVDEVLAWLTQALESLSA